MEKARDITEIVISDLAFPNVADSRDLDKSKSQSEIEDGLAASEASKDLIASW
jgi:hypothetical protein